MSKYDALLHHLSRSSGPVEVSFDDVEEILGFPLPASARRYPAWWSNSGGTHVQSGAWMAAGYRTEDVDVALARVRFVPSGREVGFGEMKQGIYAAESEPTNTETLPDEQKPHPLFGIWKGLVTLDPDYDYTQPADPDWGKVYDE